MGRVKHVLCYGDSNTFGVNPVSGGRWDEHTRWTGVLQDNLGTGYRVIEEGMCGRNCMFDDPTEEGRNGLKYLSVSLSSHRPVDLVVFMLGTNDTKTIFGAGPATIAKGMSLLVKKVLSYDPGENYPKSKVLVVAPPVEGKDVEHSTFVAYDRQSYGKSLHFAEEYKKICDQLHVPFFDAATVATAGPDQLHMDKDSHKALGEALAPIVRSLLA